MNFPGRQNYCITGGKVLASEQARITSLYERLDEERNRAAADLAAALRDAVTQRLDREAAVQLLTREVGKYRAAEDGLCFGRIDSEKGDRSTVHPPPRGRSEEHTSALQSRVA